MSLASTARNCEKGRPRLTEGQRGRYILAGDCARSSALSARLECIVRGDIHLMQLLEAARGLNLPQWRVVAGCIYQTVWNTLTGRPRGTGPPVPIICETTSRGRLV